MPLIPLKQGSDEWLTYRQGKVMASEISTIIGNNPWETKLELWERKLGLRAPNEMTPAMLRGQTLEPAARALANSIIGMNFEPIVIESDKYSYLAASLDGYYYFNGGGKYILEIKCPKQETHDDSLHKRIPIYYLDQIQMQLLCAEAEMCYYFSYRPEDKENDYSIIEVYPDLEKQAEIIAKGQEFYINMCTMNPPKEWELELRK